MALNDFSAGRLHVAKKEIDTALAIESRVSSRATTSSPPPCSSRAGSCRARTGRRRRRLALQRSLAIYRQEFGKPHFKIGIAEVYLALVQSDRGEFKAALANMDDAKHNYDVSYGRIHPNHGDLLVNRATVLARAGRLAEAREDCAAGLKILSKPSAPPRATPWPCPRRARILDQARKTADRGGLRIFAPARWARGGLATPGAGVLIQCHRRRRIILARDVSPPASRSGEAPLATSREGDPARIASASGLADSGAESKSASSPDAAGRA